VSRNSFTGPTVRHSPEFATRSDPPTAKKIEMSSFDEVTELPDDFGGLVRLFPLPDLVVFPHAMQPLHIFEPRYCDMLADSLASDRLIAMATLIGAGPGSSLTPPPIHPTVCIGRIVSHVEPEDGRHNILLIGAKRARIRRELPTNRSFRLAEVEIAPDIQPPAQAAAVQGLKAAVLDAFAEIIPASATVQNNLHDLMNSQMSLGPITDIIAFTLPLGTPAKLQLLDRDDVTERARLLIELLKRFPSLSADPASAVQVGKSGNSVSGPKNRPFPPPFSLN
jgi:Lon protease-like protein